MSYYVLKSFMLITTDKLFSPRQVVTNSEVTANTAKRLVQQGYLKSLSQTASVTEHVPFYLSSEDYLLPEELNKLNKQQLLEYAEHIGMTNLKSQIKVEQLREEINLYIDACEEQDEAD